MGKFQKATTEAMRMERGGIKRGVGEDNRAKQKKGSKMGVTEMGRQCGDSLPKCKL